MKSVLISTTIALSFIGALTTAPSVNAGSAYTICNYVMTQGAPSHVRPPGSDTHRIVLSGHVQCQASFVGGWGFYSLTSQSHVN
ncbi:hypothetical protein ACSLBF_21065 (plasmid) [Pseudoalteromonas sp. T1lg65]|uniref:hypothetical protein n=1 Tax=Pseudoalteromonas sp. T1lg65 TaxID=2077101 RepID=UPI003F7A4497